MISSILITILLVLLNGFFVAAEFAIVKVRMTQLELKVKSGNKVAYFAQDIVSKLDAYLSATQLGITLASLGLGWIGESVVAKIIIACMHAFSIEISPETAHQIALPVAFITITILHIVFGELAPKTIAIRYPESTTLAVALPMRFFYFIFKPFILILNGMANLILKLLGIPAVTGKDYHSAEELLVLLDQGVESGALQSTEHELLQNVFHFKERKVKEIMVPRTQVAAIEMPSSDKEVIDAVLKEGYSRMPVYADTVDNIIGMVHAKDLLGMLKQRETFILKDIIRPAYFIPESKLVSELLNEFQRQHIQIAIVLDEFGGTSGLVTMEDIIEELVGEIQDEDDEEKPMVEKINEHDYLVNAHIAILDANEHLPSSIPEGEDYESVAGFVNTLFKRIPEVNDTINFENYEITVVKKSKRSVLAVRFRILDKKREEEGD